MINKNITISLLSRFCFLAIIIASITSCNDDNGPDELFDQSATERLNEQAKELNQLLQSSEYGWKMTYFTDDTRYTDTDQQLGGWTFIFNFTDDKSVIMSSDFSEETLEPQQGEYEIKLGSTTKLSFSTGNYIHLLSDAANAPTTSLTGQGYKGDFEFLYYGQDGDDLIFRSNRQQIEIRFQPATPEDWQNLEIAREILPNIGGQPDKTIFRSLVIENQGVEEVFSFGYSNSTRYAKVVNQEGDDISFGIAPIKNGFIITPAIEIEGSTVSEFTYDEANDQFIAEVDSDTRVIISYGSENFIVQNNLGRLLYDIEYLAYGTDAPTSQAFANALNQVNSSLSSVNYNISQIVIDFESQQPAIRYGIEDSNTEQFLGSISHNVDLNIEDGVIRLTSGTWDLDNGFPAVLAPLDNRFLNSGGLIIERLEETFTYTNDVYKITTVNTPNFVVAMYKL